MLNGKHRSGAGFTLIELMVAISLTIMLTYGLWLLFGQASRISTTADINTQLYQTARSTFQFLDRYISGAYVDDFRRHFMWIQDGDPEDYYRVPDGSARILLSDDGRRGYLVDTSNVRTKLPWVPGQLAGMPLIAEIRGGAQRRHILTNAEKTLEVAPPWDGLEVGETGTASFNVPRRTQRLLFFTTSGERPPAPSPTPGDPAPAVTAYRAVLIALDKEHTGQSSGRRVPATLKARLATRCYVRGEEPEKFIPDQDSGVEIARNVTDFNIEYASDRITATPGEDQLNYRQSDEPSDGFAPDPYAMWPTQTNGSGAHWAEFVESGSSATTLTNSLPGVYEMSGNPPKPTQFVYADVESSFLQVSTTCRYDPDKPSLRFRELPPALRITIRVADPAGQVAHTFSQVFRIFRASPSYLEERQ